MKSRAAFLSIIILIIMVFTGCGQPEANVTENNAGNIGEWSIIVEVVGKAPVEFTNEDALKIGPVDIIAAQKDKEIFLESQTWKGILMYDLLDYLGVEEFSVISVEGADGFTQEFDPSRMSESGTGLGWMVDGKMLDEESGPIQLIAHERGPKWWIKKVTKITIIK